jgi:uncharacterized protein YjbJ (UPF0337 family)
VGNENQNEGMIDKTKGNIKEGVGKLTDDERMKREGQLDQAKGEAEETVGDVQEKVGEVSRSW